MKSEETDNEELGEDNTSNENHTLNLKVKAEVKTEDDVSTDDEYNSEKKEEPVRRRKSPCLLANSTEDIHPMHKEEEEILQ